MKFHVGTVGGLLAISYQKYMESEGKTISQVKQEIIGIVKEAYSLKTSKNLYTSIYIYIKAGYDMIGHWGDDEYTIQDSSAAEMIIDCCVLSSNTLYFFYKLISYNNVDSVKGCVSGDKWGNYKLY